MIKYIGDFNEIEKDYIEAFAKIRNDSIVLKHSPYYYMSTLSEIIEYVENKASNESGLVYFFDKKKLSPIITPAMFASNLFYNIIPDNKLKPSDCMVYIQQGCSEKCICTSAYKPMFSVPFPQIKKQILALPQRDYIILYGINVGDYMWENNTIIDLCKRILMEFPDIKIVLGNVSPNSKILNQLVKYIDNEIRIVPILYLCINSGSPKILNLENHVIKNDLKKILNNSKVCIIPYLVVGSPDETDEDFNLTLAWVNEHKDFLLGAIILPYTKNGIKDEGEIISCEKLKTRIKTLATVVTEVSIHSVSLVNLSKNFLKNLVGIAVCGEDHTYYKGLTDGNK